MMRLVLILYASLLGAAAAQDAPLAIPEEMKPLAFMAGSCWEGPLPDGSKTISHCLRWELGGRVLRDVMRIEGSTPPVRGETTYYWDLATKTLRYIFLSPEGPHSLGTVKVDGKRLIFDDERLVGRSGIIYFNSTFTQTGPDTYTQNRQRRTADGTWTNNPESTYVRKPLR